MVNQQLSTYKLYTYGESSTTIEKFKPKLQISSDERLNCQGEFHMTNEHSAISSFVASQILGDGYVDKRVNTLLMTHGQQWVEYLLWKQRILLSLGFCTSDIKIRPEETTFGHQVKATMLTRIPVETTIYNSPTELVYRLNSLGLLLWWLDDGYLSVHEKKNGTSVSRFGYLCTENFDEATNWEIVAALFNHFGLQCNVHVDKGGILGKNMRYYRIYLNATMMRLLIDIVREHIPHVPSCMLYKLNMGYRPNRTLSSVEHSLRYNF